MMPDWKYMWWEWIAPLCLGAWIGLLLIVPYFA